MKWVSVKDQLPEHDQSVLIYYSLECTQKGCLVAHCEGIQVAEYNYEDGSWSSSQIDKITHWMPLPARPE